MQMYQLYCGGCFLFFNFNCNLIPLTIIIPDLVTLIIFVIRLAKIFFMKRLLFISFTFLMLQHASAQSKLGDVACVYITTPNLDSSFAVYEKLGFSKTGASDFPVPWMQVSDGSLLIMMRKDATPYIGLTYYVADVDKVAAQLEKDSIIFSQRPKRR